MEEKKCPLQLLPEGEIVGFIVEEDGFYRFYYPFNKDSTKISQLEANLKKTGAKDIRKISGTSEKIRQVMKKLNGEKIKP